MRYEAFTQREENGDGPGQAGFKCIAEDGSVSFIYLNPSDDDFKDANIFLYTSLVFRGENVDEFKADPGRDEPLQFIIPANSLADRATS